MPALLTKFRSIRPSLKQLVVWALILGLGGITNPLAWAQNPTLNPPQLDQLLAPIALYPDPLVAQILEASTYPLEVVDASRWLKNPANAALGGDRLAAALEQQGWDPSVKSLVPFPQVLAMMDDKLDWTQTVGNAFLAQQGDVMDSVQRLRRQALAAGHLASTPQQVVSSQGQIILIQPANPQVVFLPAFDPIVVYGPWPNPDYPPYIFPPWPGYVLVGGVAFGLGLAVLSPFWGWSGFDWGHRSIHVDTDRYNAISRGRPSAGGENWRHDPSHRGGVPYRGAAVQSRFNAQRLSAPPASLDVRGYPPAITTPQGHWAPKTDRNAAGPASSRMPPAASAPPTADMRRTARPMAPRAPASAFEGVERGGAVRADVQRGQASRAPAAAPREQPTRHEEHSHGERH